MLLPVLLAGALWYGAWGMPQGLGGPECGTRVHPSQSLRGGVEYRTLSISDGRQCVTACRIQVPRCRAAIHHVYDGGSRHVCRLYASMADRFTPPPRHGELFTLYQMPDPAHCLPSLRRSLPTLLRGLPAVPALSFQRALRPAGSPLLGVSGVVSRAGAPIQPPPTLNQAPALLSSSWPLPNILPRISQLPSGPYPVASVPHTPLAPQLIPLAPRASLVPGAPSPQTGWVEWAEWGSCSASCGPGIRVRRRDCINCPGPFTETAQCSEGPCAAWAVWGQWAACSATCGVGSRTRYRQCNFGQGVQDCIGNSLESGRCESLPCAEWAQWSPFGSCSVSCGIGVKLRTRTCYLGSPQTGFTSQACPGDGTESASCRGFNCPEWQQWSPYGSCSATCGTGIRARSRQCSVEGGCLGGQGFESQTCDEGLCGSWGGWSGWGECSVTCGTGSEVRARQCEGGGQCFGGRPEERRGCRLGPCPFWTGWTEWNECSSNCGQGVQVRARVKSKNYAAPSAHSPKAPRSQPRRASPPLYSHSASHSHADYSSETLVDAPPLGKPYREPLAKSYRQTRRRPQSASPKTSYLHPNHHAFFLQRSASRNN